jgi:hypothetical protein
MKLTVIYNQELQMYYVFLKYRRVYQPANKQDKQYAFEVTSKRVLVTTLAVEKH